MWHIQLYQFTCLPNGLASAPRIFTKLLKPVYSTPRRLGHILFEYIDDSCLQGGTYSQCQANVSATTLLFQQLGFLIHDTKSVIKPTQQLTLLKSACSKLLASNSPTIREVAHVGGLLVASFPAVEYGQLYYRALEMEKIEALKLNKGNFETGTFSSLSL